MVGLNNFIDIILPQTVLAFAFFEVFAGVDKEDVIGLFAFFEHQNADRNTGREKEVGRQTDDGVDVAVLEQFGTDALFSTPPRKRTP